LSRFEFQNKLKVPNTKAGLAGEEHNLQITSLSSIFNTKRKKTDVRMPSKFLHCVRIQFTFIASYDCIILQLFNNASDALN